MIRDDLQQKEKGIDKGKGKVTDRDSRTVNEERKKKKTSLQEIDLGSH